MKRIEYKSMVEDIHTLWDQGHTVTEIAEAWDPFLDEEEVQWLLEHR